MSQPLVGMDLADLREALGSDQPGYRATQVYEAIYRGRATDLAGISALPTALRQSLAERIAFGLPEIARRFESADGTRRYLLRLEDGRTVETVLMPEGERDTMCISSQAGCAVDCKFCMTALLGLERNLTAGEIVGQVLTLLHDNKLHALYRDEISNLQKNTRLGNEAACVKAFTDSVLRWPGAPIERTLLQALPQESEPYFFGAFKGQFYYLVFLAKYPQGNVHEQVYLVKEDNRWKVAVLLLKNAY